MKHASYTPQTPGLFPALAHSVSVFTRLSRAALLAAAGLFASTAGAATIYVLTTDNKLLSAPTDQPSALTEVVTINAVTILNSETLVGIDVRPQNQKIYVLGVNAATDTGTLYLLSPENGILTAVGTAGGIAMKELDGTTTVELPDPATTTYDIDFNPAADRLRVVAGSLNFRINQNTGTAFDTDGASGNGTNPDGAIQAGTTTVSGTAYSNNQPNNGNLTTQYTLDGVTNALYIQNPPNNGTQNLVAALTLGGGAFDFEVRGFDIPPGVNTTTSGMAVTGGSGFALLRAGGTTNLCTVDLLTGAVSYLGGPFDSARSMCIRTELSVAIALSADGTTLLRFSPDTPGTVTYQALNLAGLAADETLVGIDMRPATGQFFAFGVDDDSLDEKGTLYLVDPQTGTLTAVGTTGQIAFVAADGATAIDFPDPALAGYGFDFNPSADRVRVTTSTGLNFRINQLTGAPADGNLNITPAPAGTNPDGPINGGGVTGISATAYTNSFGGATATTQYTLDAASNSISIQNAPNAGTQTFSIPVALGGTPLDFTDLAGFDIPGSVRVNTSNTAVTAGEGYFAAGVGGLTALYKIELTTGAATLLGQVDGGGTPLAGLFVSATPVFAAEQTAGVPLYAGQTLDFETVSAGLTRTLTVIVKNNGPQTLTYSTSLDSGTVYSVTSNGAGPVPAGGSRTIEIELAPFGGAGTETDVLHIVTNDVAMPSFDVNLTAETLPFLTEVDATLGAGETRVNPLALSGLNDDFMITTVSDPGISISVNGRTLIIPAGFAGTSFTYTAFDGVTTRVGTVNVFAGVPVLAPTAFAGLLANTNDRIVGTVTAKLSAKGIATVQLAAGTAKASTKISIPLPGTSGANFTSLGYVTLDRNLDGTINVFLDALGGNIFGTMVPLQKTATATKYHIALGSIEASVPGGGYAIATVSAKGAVKITGLLPDGVPFSSASALRDNDTFVFFTMVKGPKPPSTVGGELATASLVTTDVSGELRWVKLPQLPNAKGVFLDGVDTTLAATGCVYDGLVPLPDTGGATIGTLILSGGDFILPEVNNVSVAAGVPTPALGSALKTWTGVKVKVGKFSATVAVPGVTKPVKGSGIYLPKANSAWGYFPGTTEGGSINLFVP